VDLVRLLLQHVAGLPGFGQSPEPDDGAARINPWAGRSFEAAISSAASRLTPGLTGGHERYKFQLTPGVRLVVAEGS